MKYYSLLKTKEKAQDELLDMPIIALGLKPSVLGELEKYKKLNGGRMKQTFSTVRDLLEYGKGSLMGLMSTSKPSYSELKENLYHIEERLAKIGLRFTDTEFTIGEVRLSELDINNNAKALLTRLGWGTKLKTLDDIIIYNYEKLENQHQEGDRAALNNLEKAIAKYGLRIEGTKYRFTQEETFPLDDYVAYLPEDYLKEHLENDNSKLKRMKPLNFDVSSLSKEEILKIEILNLYENRSKTIIILSDLGIKTVGDLVNYDENKLRNYLSYTALEVLRDKLAKFDLSMKNSTAKVVNGIAVRNRGKNNLKNGLNISKAPKPFDFQKLNPIQKQKFLSTKIEDFGFSDSILIALKESGKYTTLNDVLTIPRNELIKDTKYSIVQTLTKAFAIYNLSLTPADNRQRYFVFNEFYHDKNVANMKDEEKAEFMKTPLVELGFTKQSMDQLAKFDKQIYTLEDLTNLSHSQFVKAGIGDSVYTSLRKGLQNFGLNFVRIDRFGNNVNTKELQQQKLVSVDTLKEEEREEFMQSGLDILCLTPLKIKKFNDANIKTISDLVKCSRKYLNQEIGIDPYTLNVIRKNLAICGLNFADTQVYNNHEKKVKEDKKWSKRNISADDLNPENREVLYAKDIDSLGLRVSAIEKLKNNGINTIGELVALNKTTAFNYLKGNMTHANEIQENLRSIGLDFAKRQRNASVEKVKSEKATKKGRIVKFTQRNIEDSDLLLENRQILLNKPVSDLGINEVIVNKLKDNNIQTIQDLINQTTTNLRLKILKNKKHANDLKDAITSIGLEFTSGYEIRKKDTITKQSSKVKTQDIKISKTTERQITEDDLKTENRDKLLIRPIEHLGINKVTVKKLNNANVYSIGDVIQYTSKEVFKGMLSSYPATYKELVSALESVGLTLKNAKGIKEEKEKHLVEEFLKKNNEDKLKTDVGELCFKDEITTLLRNNGINTVEELISNSFTDLYKKNITNNKQAIDVSKQLKLFGLTLRKVYTKRDEQSQPSKTEEALSRKDKVEFEFVTMDDYKTGLEKQNESKQTSNQDVNKNEFSQMSYSVDISEDKIQTLNVVRENLRQKGIWELYKLDKNYFISCSKELEAVKDMMREYFDDRFKTLVMGAKNETMLDDAIRKLNSESHSFETIIEQKQAELRVERDGLLKRKVESVNVLRNSIFKTIDKYHHNPYMYNTQNKDVKARNQEMLDNDELI